MKYNTNSFNLTKKPIPIPNSSRFPKNMFALKIGRNLFT